MTETSTRPKLGKLEVGHPVMVCRSNNDMQRRPDSERYIPAVVAKVGRVWVDLEKPGSESWSIYRWRMRTDNQREGLAYSGSNASFATLEQHAWDKTQNWARGVLSEHGIQIRHDSRWRGQEVELADLISKGEKA
jgi:hypothetical protein